MIEIKFIPTGHIFSLPDDEAERIVKEDRGNYEVIKGKIKEEKAPKTAKSVQELVVVNGGLPAEAEGLAMSKTETPFNAGNQATKEKSKETKTNTKNNNKTTKTEIKTETTEEKSE